ncbi:DUF1641 domain-containing protein [Salirhabdus salicampi]|uniref:DUF1641 domain-containing protein n=1 Tax=Salirhabdus salicampi TaxID=476102 RepID=UPI0020C1C896|nr:DUF1641 domain-containing protein [Salirhabdus salicampi]MCP8617273.1 DUF1641 domain-containing protein [Salirhabdus salicampi]
MAKAIKQIERTEKTVHEEREQDLNAILKQIADNREAIQETLTIIEELHNSGVLPIIRGFLRTRDKVGAIMMEEINQPGMHNVIKNSMSMATLLSSIDSEKLNQLLNGLTQGIDKATESTEDDGKVGMWGLLKSMRDPNVKASMNTMVHFLEGMGEGLNNKKAH